MQTIKEKEKRIAELFNDMIVALNHLGDDIKQSGADAYMIEKFDQSDNLKASAIALKNFAQEVNDLSTRWKNGVFSIISTETITQGRLKTNFKRGLKRTRTHLRVTFIQDNKVISSKSSAIDTFVETLLLFKLDEVAKLSMKTGYYLLVSKSKSEQNSSLSTTSGDWYINYPNTTQGKRDCLISISKKLGIAVKVDII